MEKALLTIPIIMTLIVGFASQLEDIAKDSSEKAIEFSDDMNNAMECATKGIPISVCSPDLMNYDFSAQTEEFQAVLDDMEEKLSINETNQIE